MVHLKNMGAAGGGGGGVISAAGGSFLCGFYSFLKNGTNVLAELYALECNGRE